jgi:hypothetical protein
MQLTFPAAVHTRYLFQISFVTATNFHVVKIQLNSNNKLIFVKIQLNSNNKLILLHNWSVIHHHHNELIVLLTPGCACAVRVGANASPICTGGSRGARVLLERPPLPD